jgi:hypothetical protein
MEEMQTEQDVTERVEGPCVIVVHHEIIRIVHNHIYTQTRVHLPFDVPT